MDWLRKSGLWLAGSQAFSDADFSPFMVKQLRPCNQKKGLSVMETFSWSSVNVYSFS
jgi:hypothetical protein